MLNVKDIMLGNFVKKRGEILIVGKIHRDSVADKWGEICFDDEIEPIPVTKEILKSIGFKKEKGLVSLYQYWNESDKYKLNVDEYYTNGDRRWYVQIDNNTCRSIGCGEFDYVHELQNLVRVITGRDLPITKEMIYGKVDK